MVDRHHPAASAIQEATASEPLTLEEEYDNQQSWRTSHDKLTFIACEPPSGGDDARVVEAKVDDAAGKMRGDINFFLHVDDEDDDDEDEEATGRRQSLETCLRGEVDVMIAAKEHRGRGAGEAAVRALLAYIRKNLTDIVKEYAQGESLDGDRTRLAGLMARIKEDNAASRGLFGKLGFRQEGEANYFGEVKMVMDWETVEGEDVALEYRELAYMI
ncbi:hypothetical protein Trco_001438 [Trichoderma cornu-damae]|uniref:N-acetyltransferase domain-containing protein n=1 Tax=Trichoderma cornu-damae TaxID=654480 RepID=A0A9P8QXX8_9HYPO|nr:hypothetical protein Trco_001438 [Trichoderma cornu-damae]